VQVDNDQPARTISPNHANGASSRPSASDSGLNACSGRGIAVKPVDCRTLEGSTPGDQRCQPGDTAKSSLTRRSFEGLPGRHHRCRGLKAFRCDPGASFADSERKGGYFCFHVLASFSGATHIARLLAKDAGAARSLAGAAKEAAQDTAVSKSGAVGRTTFRRESKV
jgi:hypothetical protein